MRTRHLRAVSILAGGILSSALCCLTLPALAATDAVRDAADKLDAAGMITTIDAVAEYLGTCLVESGARKANIAFSMPEDLPFERDQNINLQMVFDKLLRAQFQKTKGGTTDYLELYQTQTDPASIDEDKIEKLAKKADIILFPVATAGKRPLAALEITKSSVESCQEHWASPEVDIPKSILGEPFVEPRQLINKFGDTFFADDSRGRYNLVYLREGVTDLRGLADVAMARLPEHIEERNADSFGRKTTVVLEESAQAVAELEPDQLNWALDLRRSTTVEDAADAVRVSLIATPVDGNPSGTKSEEGLIEVDKLPHRIEAATEDIASLPPSTRIGIIKEIPNDLPSTKNLETMGERPLVYKFVLEEPSIVELDLQTAEATPLAYSLITSDDQPVEPDFRGKLRPNLTRYRLPAGVYYAKVEPNLDIADYYFRFRRSSKELVVEAPGTLLKQFGDWLVGEQVVDGRKACFAYTSATDESVTNRLQRPILYFALREGTNDPIAHKVDSIQFYNPDAPITAHIFRKGQEIARSDLHPFSTGELAPLVVKKGQTLTNPEFQRGYTDGSVMAIDGETPEGDRSEVVYSLRGYRFAVNAIAENCNRRDVYHILDYSQQIGK